MHELGHTAGLGHPGVGIMGPVIINSPLIGPKERDDLEGLRNIYESHTKDHPKVQGGERDD